MLDRTLMRYQDVFIIPEGAPGALAELERRKFTAEEGVRTAVVICFGFTDIVLCVGPPDPS